jgi:pantetheine-phosphate adenylyltransferase
VELELKIAICPGSFDPITQGHLDIIRRTAKMFDKVIVVVMVNYHKKTSTFTAQERKNMIERCTQGMTNVVVDTYVGLLAEYAKKHNAIAVVKGLRAVSDFEDEFQQALTNRKLNPDMETIFVTAEAEYMFLSSSVVKQVCEFGGSIAEFVPSEIHDDIVKRIQANKKF